MTAQGATEMITFRRRQPTDEELAAARALLRAETPDAARRSPTPVQGVRRMVTPGGASVAEGRWSAPRPSALRVGDLGIVGLPGEIFVSTGCRSKNSPFARTMTWNWPTITSATPPPTRPYQGTRVRLAARPSQGHRGRYGRSGPAGPQSRVWLTGRHA